MADDDKRQGPEVQDARDGGRGARPPEGGHRPHRLTTASRAARLPLLGVLAVTLVARLPSLWEPRWSADEGVLAATGWEMDRGQLLYVQVWNGAQPLASVWMALVVGLTRGWHP